MMKCLARPSSLIVVALLASCASPPPAAAPKDAGGVESPAPVNVQSDPGTAAVGQPGDGEPARPDRVAIRGLAELPARTYTIDSSASELMESDASFDALAVPLARDMSADMLAYDIQDPEAMKQLLGVQMNIAVLQGRYGDARAIIERIRSIETSEVKQLMTGQVMGSLIDAWEIAGPDNDASADIFERNLRDRISGLSWDMVGEEVLARRKNSAQMNEAVFRGIVVSGLDPMLQENGGVLTYEVARQLVTFKSILVLQLPLQDRINRVYTEVARSNGAEPGS